MCMMKLGKILLLQHLTTCNPKIKQTSPESRVDWPSSCEEGLSTNPGLEIDSTFEHFEMKI